VQPDRHIADWDLSRSVALRGRYQTGARIEMKRELTLLRAQPEHAETLTKIAIASKRYWNYPERWIEIWTPQLTISPAYIAHHETWVVFINEEPVAFYSLKQDGESPWLDNLWVLPTFMGQGIGEFLFRHALIRARKLGVTVLRIQSDPNAQGFYETMGALKVGEHLGEVDGQPRILPVMEIKL
jgi:GNAT superfamily N-acetyltransferase